MKPKIVQLVQTLFFLNAAIWVLFGLTSLARMAQETNSEQTLVVKGIIAAMMFGNAQQCSFAACCWAREAVVRPREAAVRPKDRSVFIPWQYWFYRSI